MNAAPPPEDTPLTAPCPEDDAPPIDDADLPPDEPDASMDPSIDAPFDVPIGAPVDPPLGGAQGPPPPVGAAAPVVARPLLSARPDLVGPTGAAQGGRRARPGGAEGQEPPANLQAERAVLSSVLIQNDSIAFAMDLVRSDDFYDPRHRYIYSAMVDLSLDGERIEPVTLLTRLRRMGAEDKAGGLAYLSELSGFSGTSLSIESYARAVAKMAIVRRVLRSVHRVQIEGFKRSVDPDEFVELVQNEVLGALSSLIGTSHVQAGEVAREVFSKVIELRDREDGMVGLPTGFRDVDSLLLGLHPTDLVILAARPSMGKTALALNIALNVAQRKVNRGPRAGEPCAVMVFSLEMGREQLVQRLLAQKASVGLTAIRTGKVDVEDEIRLGEAVGVLNELNLFIDDTPALSPLEIRARAKQRMLSSGLDLVVVDYLQLMRGTGGGRQSREQEISEISRSLKGLAKELDVAVLALSQLNRGVESRADKRPMMSDLRESGAIEQDADIILFVYRDHVYNKETASPYAAELIVAKHRAGALGEVKLHFEGKYTRFTTLEDRYDDQYTGMEPG